jgi:hypothetical protein
MKALDKSMATGELDVLCPKSIISPASQLQ